MLIIDDPHNETEDEVARRHLALKQAEELLERLGEYDEGRQHWSLAMPSYPFRAQSIPARKGLDRAHKE
jgi:hypothetical protein